MAKKKSKPKKKVVTTITADGKKVSNLPHWMYRNHHRTLTHVVAIDQSQKNLMKALEYMYYKYGIIKKCHDNKLTPKGERTKCLRACRRLQFGINKIEMACRRMFDMTRQDFDPLKSYHYKAAKCRNHKFVMRKIEFENPEIFADYTAEDLKPEENEQPEPTTEAAE